MPKCVDPISENAKTPNYWPSKMQALSGLVVVLESLRRSCWPHDAGTPSAYAPARLVADRDDSEWMHDIYAISKSQIKC